MLLKGNYLATGVLEIVDSIQWVKLSAKNATAESPSGIVFQSSGASGVVTDYYVWIDRDANLRMHTSKPTDEDSNGSVIAGAANAGASKALDNLASVAVATDIVMTDGVNVAFGTGSDYLFNYDGSDLLIDPAAANDRILIGGTTVSDIEITGAASELTWDGSADTLTLMDDAVLAFGDADDFTLTFDATYLDLDAAAAQGVFNIGKTVDTDVIFHGGTAGSDITWDASADDLIVCDDTHIAFGDGSDIYLNFNATDLEMRQVSAGTGGFKIGVDDHGIDVTFFGDTAGDFIKWDASVDMLIVEDASIRWDGANSTYDFQISTDSMLITATDHANSKFIFGTTGTNGMDVQFQGQASGDTVTFDAGAGTWTYADINTVYTGADSSGTLLALTGIDTTGNTDTMTIAHKGTGSGLKITASEADSVALELVAATSQTTALAQFDGATGSWLGADGVGMINVTNDGAFAHVNSSLLLITNSGVPADDSRGHCLRIVDTGNAAAGTAGYAAYISASDATVEALYVDAGEVLVDEYLKAGPTSTTGGLVTAYHTADLTGTPTDAEFDTGFGATALGKAGFMGVAEDSSDGKTYLVVSDGTTWHYIALTAAS